MDTPDRISKQDEVEFFFGGVLDYSKYQPEELLLAASERLRIARAFSIINFPIDKATFARFCSQFGTLMPTYGNAQLQDVFGIGDVIFNPHRSEGEQLPKERLGALPSHTGRAWAIKRPRYLAMLMKSAGEIGNVPGTNGESTLLRCRDALQEMRKRNPECYSEDLILLLSTAIRFCADHVLEESDTYPLLFHPTDALEESDISFRYKIDILSILQSTRKALGLSSSYMEAFGRLDSAIHTTDRSLVYQMEPGNLTFIDNVRIAHGRRPVQTSPGTSRVRHLFNAQIL